jgi:predicted dehydrogenase
VYKRQPLVSPNNAILEELESFAAAIHNNTEPVVSLEAGTKALEVAKQVIANFNN